MELSYYIGTQITVHMLECCLVLWLAHRGPLFRGQKRATNPGVSLGQTDIKYKVGFVSSMHGFIWFVQRSESMAIHCISLY